MQQNQTKFYSFLLCYVIFFILVKNLGPTLPTMHPDYQQLSQRVKCVILVAANVVGNRGLVNLFLTCSLLFLIRGYTILSSNIQ